MSLESEQVAAEDEGEHEDEEADAQDDDIDIERQVEELLRCHFAVGIEVLQITLTPVTPLDRMHQMGKCSVDKPSGSLGS